MNVIAIMFGRDEEKKLPRSLQSLREQSFPLHQIIYVDDASIDKSISVAQEFDATIIRLHKRHQSYVGRPELSTIINKAFDYIYSNNIPSDFIFIAGTDIYYPPTYLQHLIEKMVSDTQLVIASGVVKDEYTHSTTPRGAGRLIRTSFWNKHVKYFPFKWVWESYPVYKARALGFKTHCFSDIIQYALRPTKPHEEKFGYIMRELGYNPLYALGMCLLASIRRPKSGLKMLYNYLTCGFAPHDEAIAQWIRFYQARRILKLFHSFH